MKAEPLIERRRYKMANPVVASSIRCSNAEEQGDACVGALNLFTHSIVVAGLAGECCGAHLATGIVRTSIRLGLEWRTHDGNLTASWGVHFLHSPVPDLTVAWWCIHLIAAAVRYCCGRLLSSPRAREPSRRKYTPTKCLSLPVEFHLASSPEDSLCFGLVLWELRLSWRPDGHAFVEKCFLTRCICMFWQGISCPW